MRIFLYFPNQIRGKESTCKDYSSLSGGPPAWGLTGDDSEDLTRHVMCCLDRPPEKEPAPTSSSPKVIEPFTETEQIVLDTYKAEWFGRDDGYQGTTYLEVSIANKLIPLVLFTRRHANNDSINLNCFPLVGQVLQPYQGHEPLSNKCLLPKCKCCVLSLVVLEGGSFHFVFGLRVEGL